MLFWFNAQAQGELEYEFDTHDFGTIAEGTKAVFNFRVRNKGNQPVVITNVQPSCGCTTPEWTKTPILPGKIGFIRAIYNSTGRPGPFNKSITVTSNGVSPTHVLYIKGEVGPADLKTIHTQEQKTLSPRLAVGRTTYSFGKLEKGQKAVAKFQIKNTGRQDLQIQGVRSACNCVSYKVSDPAIKPGQTATLELTYVPAMLSEQNEVVTIISNDIVMPALRLTLKATVVESLVSENMVKEGKQPIPFR
ncbi:DUF1573 domain-containing protein [Pontibacter liquoris]|uniref:DUF1573 domain-containing protein n=1 Tax=Pontibacter liquoris TaxID=2905677 RepID=UPI001FA6F807|nr:DUF1573 domain-containing protein [Pontibacter liquoris]